MNTGGGSFDMIFEKIKNGKYVCIERDVGKIGIRLVPNDTLYFMPINEAIVLSNLIQEAVNKYFNEHPEEIYEQELRDED